MRKLAFIALVMAFSVTAQAEKKLNLDACTIAPAPIVANGLTASEDEMADSSRAVRSHIGDIQAALACLESAEKSMGRDITSDQRSTINAQYNVGVDQLNTISEEYNQQVRAFKDR